jgi:hypothetical protein
VLEHAGRSDWGFWVITGETAHGERPPDVVFHEDGLFGEADFGKERLAVVGEAVADIAAGVVDDGADRVTEGAPLAQNVVGHA